MSVRKPIANNRATPAELIDKLLIVDNEEPWNEDDWKNPHELCDAPSCNCGIFKDDDKYLEINHHPNATTPYLTRPDTPPPAETNVYFPPVSEMPPQPESEEPDTELYVAHIRTRVKNHGGHYGIYIKNSVQGEERRIKGTWQTREEAEELLTTLAENELCYVLENVIDKSVCIC